MANSYIVDRKHTKYFSITDSNINDTNTYTLNQDLYNKWIKVDTSNTNISIFLPNELASGFHCIIENVGSNKVNYTTTNNNSIRSDEDKYTDTRFRSVEINYDKSNSEWRIQGYIGKDDINSLYDVRTNLDRAPSNGDVLVYDEESGFWKAGSNPSFLTSRPAVLSQNFTITNQDHGSVIVVDTSANSVEITFELGLEEGLYVKLLNISEGFLRINTPGNLVGVSETYYAGTCLEVYHLSSNNYYSVAYGSQLEE